MARRPSGACRRCPCRVAAVRHQLHDLCIHRALRQCRACHRLGVLLRDYALHLARYGSLLRHRHLCACRRARLCARSRRTRRRGSGGLPRRARRWPFNLAAARRLFRGLHLRPHRAGASGHQLVGHQDQQNRLALHLHGRFQHQHLLDPSCGDADHHPGELVCQPHPARVCPARHRRGRDGRSTHRHRHHPGEDRLFRAVCVRNGLRRRRAGFALPLCGCQHRLQQQLVVPGADSGPARRPDAALGSCSGCDPACRAFRVPRRHIPAPLRHRARFVLRRDRLLPAGRVAPLLERWWFALRKPRGPDAAHQPLSNRLAARLRAGAARLETGRRT